MENINPGKKGKYKLSKTSRFAVKPEVPIRQRAGFPFGLELY